MRVDRWSRATSRSTQRAVVPIVRGARAISTSPGWTPFGCVRSARRRRDSDVACRRCADRDRRLAARRSHERDSVARRCRARPRLREHAARQQSERSPALHSRSGSPNMSWKIDWVEGVEVGEDLAALGAEGVGVVEDRGDAALLGEGWEGNLERLERRRDQLRRRFAPVTRATGSSHARLRAAVEQVRRSRSSLGSKIVKPGLIAPSTSVSIGDVPIVDASIPERRSWPADCACALS